jgi:hypothetical protein
MKFVASVYQPDTATSDNLDQFLQPNMPLQHDALCGCED